MSFERFGSSDVYIFEHVGGFIQCCGCSLVNPEDEEMFGSAELKTPREALVHLDLHEEADDDIGGAKRRIEKGYENLDAPIEPYVRSEEEEESAQRARLKEILMAKKKSNEESAPEPHRYSSTEVDRQNSESYIDGYAHGFGVLMGACEKSLRALDATMGFYMEDDLGRYDDRVKELGLAHNAIRFAMAEMDQAYDEEMRELKGLWKLEGYIANID